MTEFWYCLTHDRVEHGNVCRATDRLGPYESEAEARAWRDRHATREETWEEEDEAWRGDDQRG